jgi:type I restriction enzyme S subunit
VNLEQYVFPSNWQVKPIKEVTLHTSNRDPGRQPNQTFQYIDISSIDNSLFKISSTTIIKGFEAPSRARKAICAKDVLFATVRPKLKRVALVPQNLDGEIASTGYCVLRPDSEKIDSAFL